MTSLDSPDVIKKLVEDLTPLVYSTYICGCARITVSRQKTPEKDSTDSPPKEPATLALVGGDLWTKVFAEPRWRSRVTDVNDMNATISKLCAGPTSLMAVVRADKGVKIGDLTYTVCSSGPYADATQAVEENTLQYLPTALVEAAVKHGLPWTLGKAEVPSITGPSGCVWIKRVAKESGFAQILVCEGDSGITRTTVNDVDEFVRVVYKNIQEPPL